MFKVPKMENWQYFFNQIKDVATAFVFYCDANLLGEYAQKLTF